MASRIPTVRLWMLLAAELRALPRNVFALSAFAATLALLALAGAFTLGGPGAMQGFLVVMWLVAPLGVAIAVAARVASVRRSRFVDSLYTTPLTQPTWLAAQSIVGIVMAAFVMIASAPFVLVYAAHLGALPDAPGLLLAGAALSAFAVALGLLCGVLAGDAGAGAAAGMAGGAAALSFVAFIVQGVLASANPDPLALQVIRVTHLSPVTLAVEASGTTLFPFAPSSTASALLGLGALTLCTFAAAWIAFTRHQGPLGWERRRGAWIVGALVVASIAIPIATADVSYHSVPSDRSIRFNPGEHTRIGFVRAGEPIDADAFSPFTTLRDRALWFDQDAAFDMLVLLTVPPNATISDLRIVTDGGSALAIRDGSLDIAGNATPDGTAQPPGFPGEASQPAGPVFRVPIVLHPVRANALLYAHANLAINTTFAANGKRFDSAGSIPMTIHVPGASAQLLAAGAPLPLAFAGGAIVRKLRTR